MSDLFWIIAVASLIVGRRFALSIPGLPRWMSWAWTALFVCWCVFIYCLGCLAGGSGR